jgi:predicted phosphodiesterase
MRRFLQRILKKPIEWLAEKLSSAPHQKDVFASLNGLVADIEEGKKSSGLINQFDYTHDKFIVFSDQHKGIRNSVDDFMGAENSYLAALQYYYDQQFQYINLGDCEELWKNTPVDVMKKNGNCFEAEKKFLDRNQYYRVFGNHDLAWKFILQQNVFLKPVFGKNLKVYEGILLKTTHNNKTYSIFLAHGHQGDKRNDGNAFSIWVVANLWTPIQRYLHVSINTPATSFELTDRHNIIMYDWSATQTNLIFISGHTHKPVFASLDHIEKLTKQLDKAKQVNDSGTITAIQQELKERQAEYPGKQQLKTMAKPSYFNSGCCCFEDGDITGIEIAEGYIRLVKWKTDAGISRRMILEESPLADVFEKL